MPQRNDGGSAFPFEQITVREAGAPSKWINHSGMSLRQYAAIKLRVPDSGTDWLDDMIRQSLRTDLAAKAMQAAATNPKGADGFTFEERAGRQTNVQMVPATRPWAIAGAPPWPDGLASASNKLNHWRQHDNQD